MVTYIYFLDFKTNKLLAVTVEKVKKMFQLILSNTK
jgi:hypothetical protein